MTDRALIADLVNALECQASTIETAMCTCIPEDVNRNHAQNRRRRDSCCVGVRKAVEFRRVAALAHRRLARRFVDDPGEME